MQPRDYSKEIEIDYEQEGSRGHSWWFTILLAVIGFGAGYVVGIRGTGPGLNSAKFHNVEAQSPVATTSAKYALEVDDQSAGLTVLIATVHMVEAGWIAIREDAGGTPGRILGAQFFAKGDSVGEVSLLRATVPGATYYAELRTDDGDHLFDLNKDSVVPESAGRISTPFKTLEKSAPPRNDLSQ